MLIDGCRFNPIRCTESKLETLRPEEGHLYFTTDSKKIYLGKNGEKVLMYDKSNFYYATKLVVYENTGTMPDPNVTFEYDEIIDSKFIQVNDLILNIGTDEAQDGCFYRVVKIEDELIETLRITMRGGGGGFGGTGDGSDVAPGTPSLSIKEYSPASLTYATLATPSVQIGIKPYSSESTNVLIRVECSFSKDVANDTEKFIITENLAHSMDTFYYAELAPHLEEIRERRDMTTQNTTVYMHITDMYGTTRTKSFTIQVAELNMTSFENSMLSESAGAYRYTFTPSGIQNLSSYEAVFEYYNENNVKVYSHAAPFRGSLFNSEIVLDLPQEELPHGAYTMKAYIRGSIGTTKLTSNVLSYTMIHFDPDVSEPILGIVLPETIEQYAEFPITYVLEYGKSIKPFNLDIKLNNKLISQEEVLSGQLNSYPIIIENLGKFTLSLIIEALNINKNYEIEVVEYNGTIPVIETGDVTLTTYLNPRGRTNNSLNRESWANSKNESQKGTLSNFYYREINGWLKDNNGIDYLKVSQGASVEYLAESPLSGSPDTTGFTIELDFKLSGVYDYDEPFIECLSYYNDDSIKTGFTVDGKSFNYYIDGEKACSLSLVTEKRIRLTQVVSPSQLMCLTYLDGIISKLMTYEASENKFGNNPQRPAYLKINSNGGQIHIYGIRFYSTDLSTPKILRNYQASLDTLDMRKENYRENNVFKQGKIDVDQLNEDGYEWDIPYVKIVGGYSIIKDEDTGDMIMAPAAGNVTALPTGKKDYRAIDIEMHYPKYDPITGKNAYFKDYHDFKFVSEFGEEGLDVTNAFGKTMSKGAWMYAQGTSSMVYPVKNLRVKTKGSDFKFTVQPGLDPVKLVCFKADYMESSGSHNTGAANYIDNYVYQFSGLKTPGQKHYADKKIVTCIKGHPCLIFWSPTGEKNTFQFIGKYNFNLDKATHEPFGLVNDKNDPTFGYLTNEAGELALGSDGKPQNSIYCFEFLDNVEKVCNFIHDEKSTFEGFDEEVHETGMTYPINNKTEAERYYDSWYSKRRNEEGKIVHGWQLGFESRYPEDKEDLHDADVLFNLASWINDTYALEQTDGRAAAVKKFKDEYWKYLDESFTVAYYVITDTLLMVDSRVKNMMIATWGKEWRYLLNNGTVTSQKPEDESTIKDSHFGFIWYPLFYDMDTMLGLDNIGEKMFDYYDDDSRKVYNGDTVLWYFVKDALPERIKEYYQLLESKSIVSKEMILPCFSGNQGSLANEAFYNEDAKYKYISPFLLNHSGVKLPAAQGSRELDREYFITNRINYLNGKYSTESHQEKDCLEYRMTKLKKIENPQTEEDIKINKSLEAVPPSGEFELTSTRTCYAGVKVGASFANKKFNGEETATIKIDVDSADKSETYITGISSIAAIGSLANKYPYGFNFNGLAGSPLRKLVLGDHHKDYYNPLLASADAFDLSMLTYLEEFNMENCGSFNGSLNFAAKNPVYDETGTLTIAGTTGCNTLKNINLLGSQAGSIALPSGGILEVLRLPDSIKSLKLDSFVELTDDNFTLGYYDYDTETYVNNYLKLDNLHIKDTPGIDSYAIIKQIYQAPVANLMNYYLNGINWTLNSVDDFEIENVNEKDTIVGIKALDYLSKLTPNGGSHGTSLIGTITIDIPNYVINEANLSAKYLNESMYPNVKIKFGSNSSGVVESYFVKFYDQKDTESAGNITPDLFEQLTPILSLETDAEKGKTISELIVESGKVLKELTKPSTNDTNYFFNGKWRDWNDPNHTLYYEDYSYEEVPNDKVVIGSETYYEYDSNNCSYQEWHGTELANWNILYKKIIPETSFQKVKPTKDMYLIPEFDSAVRTYPVAFYDNNVNLFYWPASYNANVADLVGNDSGLKYMYREDYNNQLGENERFTFKGWITEEDYVNQTENPTLVNFADFIVTKPLNFHAYYVIEDATKVASDPLLFTIDNNGVSVDGTNISCIKISLNSEYRERIGGKITVPSKDANGNIIKAIGNFQNTPEWRNVEIYFLEDAQYEYVADDAFKYTEYYDAVNDWTTQYSIKKITLPNGIKTIGANAFRGTLIDELILPDSVETIGSCAFAYPLDSKIHSVAHIKAIHMPDTLTTIGYRAFWKAANLQLTTLPANLTTLGEAVFDQCSKVALTSIPAGVTHIPEQCFMSCPNLAIATFGAVSIDASAFSFSATINTTVTRLDLSEVISIPDSPIFENAYTYVTNVTVPEHLFGCADVSELSLRLFGPGRTIDNWSTATL